MPLKTLCYPLATAGCTAVLAVAAAPASAQLGPLSGGLTGALGVTAVKDGAKGRVAAKIALPVGTSVRGEVKLGKRVLCKMAKREQVTEGALTGVSCTFPLSRLGARKSTARASTGQFIALRLFIEAKRMKNQKETLPPIVLGIPIAVQSFGTA